VCPQISIEKAVKNPLVSILIPNYNKELFLKNTLDSILQQSYKNWECIVVDDGSTDQSWNIITSFSNEDKRIKAYKRPDTFSKGGNTCRNHAFYKSSGDYVIFFDSDDLLLTESIEKRVTAIQESNYDFVVFQGVYWDLIDSKALVVCDIQTNNVVEDFLSFNPHWVTPSLIIKRDFLIKENISWKPEIPYFQDVFFNLELLSKDVNFAIKETTDWIWRKSSQESLGKTSVRVASYNNNFQIATAYQNALKNLKKENKKAIYEFCLMRFYQLLQLNQNKKNYLFPLLAYIDFLRDKEVISSIKYLKIKSIALIGLISFSKNISIGRSIFFRYWKKVVLSKYVKPVNKHFLIRSVAIGEFIQPNSIN
jgi:glycosyltransferase involved in cell wall biosynthesis